MRVALTYPSNTLTLSFQATPHNPSIFHDLSSVCVVGVESFAIIVQIISCHNVAPLVSFCYHCHSMRSSCSAFRGSASFLVVTSRARCLPITVLIFVLLLTLCYDRLTSHYTVLSLNSDNPGRLFVLFETPNSVSLGGLSNRGGHHSISNQPLLAA